MGNQQYHRRFARGAGYMCWSLPGVASALRMPWSDVLGPSGHVDRDHLSVVLGALRRFEAEIAELKESDTWPPLPTPNAQVIYMDNTVFEEELADRLVVYKERINGVARSADG